MPTSKQQDGSTKPIANLTVPELEQSKISVLATLPSAHSRRTYRYAIERFIDWYCSEPRLGSNRCAAVRYRSYLESLAESGWLSPELATGIRRVKGVRQLTERYIGCKQKLSEAVNDRFPISLSVH